MHHHQQQRLERYFKPSSTPNQNSQIRSFLDLPAAIRRRIYEAAQIVPSQGAKWGKISLNRQPITERRCLFDAQTEKPYEFAGGRFGAAKGCHRCCFDQERPIRELELQHARECVPLPLGLFSTCTALYQEVVDLFYSQNRFEIAYNGPNTLSVLEKLSPRVVASLRSLTIHVTANHCQNRRCSPGYHQLNCHPCCKAIPHDEPLGSRPGSRRDKMALEAFRRACQHLGPYVRPNQLQLAVSCDVQDSLIASQLLSYLDNFPTLASCTVSLSRDFDPDLRKMAQEASLRLTGHPQSRVTGSFPLRQLPRELQLRILEFSGIVAPFHLFYDPALDQPDLNITTTNCVYEESKWGSSSPFDHCRDLPVICCCSSGRHSTSSWACDHWHFPAALFAVDRMMREDARNIMYRGNAWDGFPRSWYSNRHPHLHALVQANTRRFLGEVQNLTCNLIPEWSGNAEMAIETVLAHCNIGSLTLILRLPHPIHERGTSLGDSSELPWRPHRDLMNHVNSVLASRHGWKRLKAFFVDVAREHINDDSTDYNSPLFRDCSTSKSKQDEAEYDLEQLVVRAGFASDAGVATKRANVHAFIQREDSQWPWLCTTCVGLSNVERLGWSHRMWLYH
ncbi:hypothetical protein BX600DRAFT_472173 [Xylariales sp. PMI_506]|nr:hypothetical protein BX600DRAFT_472173 [Xylariales sp. PMI_506]